MRRKGRSSAKPIGTRTIRPPTRVSSAPESFKGIPTSRAKTLTVPPGRTPIAVALSQSPRATSFSVPSPPHAIAISKPGLGGLPGDLGRVAHALRGARRNLHAGFLQACEDLRQELVIRVAASRTWVVDKGRTHRFSWPLSRRHYDFELVAKLTPVHDIEGDVNRPGDLAFHRAIRKRRLFGDRQSHAERSRLAHPKLQVFTEDALFTLEYRPLPAFFRRLLLRATKLGGEPPQLRAAPSLAAKLDLESASRSNLVGSRGPSREG